MIILPEDTLARAIIQGAQSVIPILEDPIGSNLGPELNAMADRWHVPRGQPWCAGVAADIWHNAGADVPPARGTMHPWKAESWRLWALSTGRFSPTPVLGAAPLYGTGGHEPASHMGICVVSLSPILMNIEGNTSEAGYSREGEMTGLKRVNTDRLIGYVHPRPIS